MSRVPEGLPTLSKGAHKPGEGKACVMEYVALLNGETWTDRPQCTHPSLAQVARVTNDQLPDSHRHLLVPLIGRLFGTSCDPFESDRIQRDLTTYWLNRYGKPSLTAAEVGGPEQMVKLLSDLIDEYDRLTGRTSHREVSDVELAGLAEQVSA